MRRRIGTGAFERLGDAGKTVAARLAVFSLTVGRA